MRRPYLLIVAMAVVAVFLFSDGCVIGKDDSQSKRGNVIAIPGGTVSPVYGVGFDVIYDPSLDNVVPGYKILTVAYTNNSMDIIQMEVLNDKWYVVDRSGGKKQAIINLRDRDPDVWKNLSQKLKILLEYPLLIPAGATQTIDLLFKKSANLGEFKMVIYKQDSSGRQFRIYPREG